MTYFSFARQYIPEENGLNATCFLLDHLNVIVFETVRYARFVRFPPATQGFLLVRERFLKVWLKCLFNHFKNDFNHNTSG